jgi:hypothetical protein
MEGVPGMWDLSPRLALRARTPLRRAQYPIPLARHRLIPRLKLRPTSLRTQAKVALPLRIQLHRLREHDAVRQDRRCIYTT